SFIMALTHLSEVDEEEFRLGDRFKLYGVLAFEDDAVSLAGGLTFYRDFPIGDEKIRRLRHWLSVARAFAQDAAEDGRIRVNEKRPIFRIFRHTRSKCHERPLPRALREGARFPARGDALLVGTDPYLVEVGFVL